jgi:hypothetical protein
VLRELRAKQAAPLEPMALSKETIDAIAAYDKSALAVSAISDALNAINPQ